MLSKICLLTSIIMYSIVIDNFVTCEDNFMKINPRFPRSNSKTNNEEFEKFFLKASKSVPRIGRRGYSNDNSPDNFNPGQKYQFFRYPFGIQPKRAINKNLGAPFWSDIAHIYEYNPELPNMLEYLSNLEQEQGDDPSAYDVNNIRFKKTKNIPNNDATNKELPEYRTQPEI